MYFDDNAVEITVAGVVMASEWDEEDDIIEIEISTDDDVYCVEKNALWGEVADLCDKQVEVTGLYIKEKDGTKRILVTDYELLEDFPDDDENENQDDFYDDLDFENDEEEMRYS